MSFALPTHAYRGAGSDVQNPGDAVGYVRGEQPGMAGLEEVTVSETDARREDVKEDDMTG